MIENEKDKEVEELKALLRAAGYGVCEISEPLGELIPIGEAVKDAPMHWP